MASNEDLKTTVSWYSTALNSLGDGVIAADTEGKVTFLNPAAQRLTGWTQPEAVGQDIATVYHLTNATTGEAVPHLLADKATGDEGGEVPFNKVLVARDGTHIHVTDRAAPLQEAGEPVIGVIVVFRDTTTEYETLQAVEQRNKWMVRDFHERFYRSKSNLQLAAALIEMGSDEGNLSWFPAMALTHFIHAEADMVSSFAMETESGTVPVIAVHDTLQRLISIIQATIRHRPVLFQCEHIRLPTRQSASLAHVVNAAISHAYRHGNGNIVVRVAIVEGEICLDVYDDGASISATVEPHDQAYILWGGPDSELEMIETLVRLDLKGRILETSDTGGRVRVAFPVAHGE